MTLEDLYVPPFCITIQYNGRYYNITVTQIYLEREHEIFEVRCGKSAKQLISLRPHYRLVHKSLAAGVHLNKKFDTPVKDYKALEIVCKEIGRVISDTEEPLLKELRNGQPPPADHWRVPGEKKPPQECEGL